MSGEVFPYIRTGNEIIGIGEAGLAEIRRRMPNATEEEVIATVHGFGWLMPDEFKAALAKNLGKPWNERAKMCIIPNQGE